MFKAKTAANRDGKEKKTSDTRKPVVDYKKTLTKYILSHRDLIRENQMRVREKRTGAKTKKTRGAKREGNLRRKRTTRMLSSACGAMRTARRGEV